MLWRLTCGIRMSEKTKQILENLKSITQKDAEDDTSSGPIASNVGGDRIYSNLNNNLHLINQDGSKYKGKIFKRRTVVKGLDGNNFFSYVYETDDNRWFNRVGLPIPKPNNIVKQSDNEVEQESK